MVEDDNSLEFTDDGVCPYCLQPMRRARGKKYCSKRCKDSWWDWKTGKRETIPFDPSNLASFYETRSVKRG